jgi:peptidyl-prolyl cis-trans isomerase B (cyclophilin B)
MKKTMVVVLAACALVAAAAAFAEEKMPVLSAEAAKLPAGTNVAVMTLTDGGVVEIQMFDAETPDNAANFETLAEAGFYDGIPFHRVVADFVVQAGEGTLAGKSNPTHVLNQEAGDRSCVRGAIAMARLMDIATHAYGATSPNQFFIVTKDATQLDPDFTVFGAVVSGMAAVDKITQWNGAAKSGSVIKSIRIVTVGSEGKAPTIKKYPDTGCAPGKACPPTRSA